MTRPVRHEYLPNGPWRLPQPLHALTAAGTLPSETAVRRLLAVTMAGLRPPPGG